jgi:RNA 3'-phosphate cyclase
MGDLVQVDGSLGEGGGQVLRLAVAMSAASGSDLRITNIRAGRERPGLAAQHVAAASAVMELCGGRSEGLRKGGLELSLHPSRTPGGRVEVDVGTAGSVTLVLQASLGALSAPTGGPGQITVTGGTDVIMAPSWDYLSNVLAPVLVSSGLPLEPECQKRGFFPVGGGRVRAEVGARSGSLSPFLPRATTEPTIKGSIVYSQLPDHIPKRIDHAIRKELIGLDVEGIRKSEVPAACPGVVATLWAEAGDAVLGASMVGRRGLPSEEIGSSLGRSVREDLEAGATVDVHLMDQLMVHAALSRGTSELRTRTVSLHAQTALEVVRLFKQMDVSVEDEEGCKKVTITPGEE